jgi:hypothetical protein
MKIESYAQGKRITVNVCSDRSAIYFQIVINKPVHSSHIESYLLIEEMLKA